MPVVSVIIPNYNHSKFLEKRIQTVLCQTYQDFEIILLDDLSTDDSRSIIENYRNNDKVTAIIYNKINSGSTFKQWERGLAAAKGEFIWIAESDDYASPEFLENVLTPLINDEKVVISFCRSSDIDENDHLLGLTLHADKLDAVKWTHDYVEDAETEVKKYLKFRNTIPNASAVVFKKPANIGAYLDTTMRYCGDWLFWIKLMSAPNSKIAYCSKPLNFFRTHQNTTRAVVKKANASAELKRFNEYRKFVPGFLINPLDERYSWMVNEWIDRGRTGIFKGTRYHYFPNLHPVLALGFYLRLIKKMAFKKNFTI